MGALFEMQRRGDGDAGPAARHPPHHAAAARAGGGGVRARELETLYFGIVPGSKAGAAAAARASGIASALDRLVR